MTQPKPYLEAKKSLGQNFLKSDVVPNWLCEAAQVMAGDQVLEVGPGTGALTRSLLERGALVTAIEADERAIDILKREFASALDKQQLRLIKGDALEVNPDQLGYVDHQFKVVANIPYYISGRLLRTYLTNSCQPSTLVFLLQKELVERITRDPKSSLLALSVKAYGEPKYIKTVSRGHFEPSPKVDSAILAITKINRANFTELSEADFFALLHLGLGQRRKQLLGNLSQNYDRARLTKIFTDLGLPLHIRGEDLNIETWLKLATNLMTP